MASTNKTTNYQLSQFVGSDKPAWLADYNSDMNKIDAGIKSADDTATGADGKADANATNIGDLTALATTAKTSLVAAVNEVNTSAATAAGVADSASATANSALTKASGLESALNVTPYDSYTYNNFVVTQGNASINSGTVYVAKNTDGSLAKIYGSVIFNLSASSGSTTVRITSDCGLRPTSDLTISATSLMFARDGNGVVNGVYAPTIEIKTTGELLVTFNKPSNTQLTIRLLACLLFVKDFGDTPEA